MGSCTDICHFYMRDYRVHECDSMVCNVPDSAVFGVFAKLSCFWFENKLFRCAKVYVYASKTTCFFRGYKKSCELVILWQIGMRPISFYIVSMYLLGALDQNTLILFKYV